MNNGALVAVLVVIVLLFAAVVLAVLLWYKKQAPHQEVISNDDIKNGEVEAGSPKNDSHGSRPLLETKQEASGVDLSRSFYEDSSNSPKTPLAGPGIFPARKREPNGSISNLRDSRSFSRSGDHKLARSGSQAAYSPPKRAGKSSPIATPELSGSQNPSPLLSNFHGSGNPLSTKGEGL
eukprot:TRINITY_DN10236_c0_g1_i1.p1 TRINITY_DN10236_c0_g1~~TRINITY_DN10236_c0_g1_i1.p1  ORF type:complete len:179 (+),score=37.66 TRINITY_DN10236_c0_g1_i1:47-583(+)